MITDEDVSSLWRLMSLMVLIIASIFCAFFPIGTWTNDPDKRRLRDGYVQAVREWRRHVVMSRIPAWSSGTAFSAERICMTSSQIHAVGLFLASSVHPLGNALRDDDHDPRVTYGEVIRACNDSIDILRQVDIQLQEPIPMLDLNPFAYYNARIIPGSTYTLLQLIWYRDPLLLLGSLIALGVVLWARAMGQYCVSQERQA